VKQAAQKVYGPGLTLQAPAKINLFLKILNRRADGYHEIESQMQKITLFDMLHLSGQGDSISLSCPGSAVPTDRENIVFKAAEAFLRAAGITTGIRIVLEKNIPAGAGLGGGSSDAAAALLGLNTLLGTNLAPEHLMEIGLRLGADVPFFIRDCSGAIATGIGERIHKVEPLRDFWIVLVNPGFAVSTKWVYDNFPLTSCSNPYILAPGRKMDGDWQGVSPELFEQLGNDLEAVSINRYPEIGDIKKELQKAGAAAVLMSGSGPTVFGLFPGREEARHCFRQFALKYGNNVFLVRPYIP